MCVEDVCSVLMHVDAVAFFTIHIVACVSPALEHKALFAALGHFMRKHAAEQSAADDEIVVHTLSHALV